MSAPYYTGDTVPLKFTISDAEGGIAPSAVKVTILTPGNILTDEVDATIDGNAVSYNVPNSVNDMRGLYKAYFICTLSYGERTHKIEYTIINNPEEER